MEKRFIVSVLFLGIFIIFYHLFHLYWLTVTSGECEWEKKSTFLHFCSVFLMIHWPCIKIKMASLITKSCFSFLPIQHRTTLALIWSRASVHLVTVSPIFTLLLSLFLVFTNTAGFRFWTLHYVHPSCQFCLLACHLALDRYQTVGSSEFFSTAVCFCWK